MFRRIMTPVDLTHAEALSKALDVAADLAGHWGAELVLVGVTANTPGATARNPEAYAEELAAFAAGRAGGARVTAHPVVSHDPAADLDRTLLAAVEETGADLVVMATHVPGFAERFWPSHGGAIANRTAASVLLVRTE